MIEGLKEVSGKWNFDLVELAAHYLKNMNEDGLYYLEKRGITAEAAEAFQIGFEPGKIGFYVEKQGLGDYFENRIVLPIVRMDGTIVDLLGRAIDHREPKYKALFGIDETLFNEVVLEDSEDVVVCNGVFDVMTLAQNGLPAVCVPNKFNFREQHVEKLREKRIFICMGNDEHGRRESSRIEALLADHAKEVYKVQLPETIRDVNDFFVRAQNPMEGFMQLLNQSIEETLSIPIAPDVRNVTVFTEEYMKRHRGHDMKIETGFAQLDKLLYGGLSGGLYLLAGKPAIGKTLWFKQIADAIAMAQHPVIYAAWDSTPYELWAQSIARIIGTSPAIILNGRMDPESIQTANQTYLKLGKMLWTLECSLLTHLDQLATSVETIANVAGKIPVLIIDDLLQASFQEHPDAVLQRLKAWSKEWGMCVLTSLPYRDSYNELPLVAHTIPDVIMDLQEVVGSTQETRLLSLDLVKNKQGANGIVGFSYKESTALFQESK